MHSQMLPTSEASPINYLSLSQELFWPAPEAQDRDLLLIVNSSVHDHEHQAVSEEHSDMEHTSPTATSTSSTAPSSPKANRERSQEHAELTTESETAHTSTSSDGEPEMEPKSIASGSNLKREAIPKQQRRRTGSEHTSPSSEMEPKHSAAGSNLRREASHKQPGTPAVVEHTSPSSEMEPLVDNGIASASHLKRKASPKRRAYNKRGKTTGSSNPTIPTQWIFNIFITTCRKAAETCIGVSAQRVQRVLHGLPDGRRRGHRVPNNHLALTSVPMRVCLRFLWREYHFDAEGLPGQHPQTGWHEPINRHKERSLSIHNAKP